MVFREETGIKWAHNYKGVAVGGGQMEKWGRGAILRFNYYGYRDCLTALPHARRDFMRVYIEYVWYGTCYIVPPWKEMEGQRLPLPMVGME
jgi:hypothetical protein